MSNKPMTTKELIAWHPEEVPYIISDGIFNVQNNLIIFGQFETWKSWIAMHLGYTVSNGSSWFGFDTNPYSSLLFQLEIPQTQLRKRVVKYCKGNNAYPENVWLWTRMFMKLQGPGLLELKHWLDKLKPDILIVDPIYAAMAGDLTNNVDADKFIQNINILKESYNMSIVLISHTRKTQFTEAGPIAHGAEEMIGSSLFEDWADTILKTSKVDDDLIKIEFTKVRHAERILKPMLVRIDRQNLRFKVEI